MRPLPSTRAPCFRCLQDEVDPTKGLWGLVKQMYHGGDQEFKQTVTEVLSEHRRHELDKVAPLPGLEPESDEDVDDAYRDF